MPKAAKQDEGRLPRLIDTRDRLQAAIAACKSPRDLPALSREYRMTLAEIDSHRREGGGRCR